MKFAFISILSSSNNLSRAKMIQVSILVVENAIPISKFETYIKAVPALSKTEKASLNMDYSEIRSASPLCDLAPSIIKILENSHSVFTDKFSASLFKKEFRTIGFSTGNANFILERIFKNYLKSPAPFSLKSALEQLKIYGEINSGMEKCHAMSTIFGVLSSLEEEKSSSSQFPIIGPPCKAGIDLNYLPKAPGVYFFRRNDEIIYVGKAKNISQRVKSHFNSKLRSEKDLCENTTTVDFEETGSETIALLLEADYIHKLKPIYNSLQKEIIDPYIIASKIDSKGILRIQLLQKSYSDSENEFYYNRDSVLQKVKEVQQKFNLCKRYTGIERTASKCSDLVFCKGICHGLEAIETYNNRVQAALDFIFAQRPSYILRLKGRTSFEQSLILVKKGIYHGFGYIDSETHINSLEDIESFVKSYPHTYFTSRILDQFFKNNKISSEKVISLVH